MDPVFRPITHHTPVRPFPPPSRDAPGVCNAASAQADAELEDDLCPTFEEIVKARDDHVRQIKLDKIQAAKGIRDGNRSGDAAAAAEVYDKFKVAQKAAHTDYKLTYGRSSQLRATLVSAVTQELWGAGSADGSPARLLRKLSGECCGNAILDVERKHQLIWQWSKNCDAMQDIWKEDNNGELPQDANQSFDSYDWSQESQES